MNESGSRLYGPQLLELALRLASWPVDDSLPLQGEARAPVCGSHVLVGIQTGVDGTIGRLGLRAQACVVGQAACAIFAENASGRTAEELGHALSAIEGWLSGAGPLPDWPGLAPLVPAQAYPGRHGAMMLPWRAALAALQSKSQAL